MAGSFGSMGGYGLEDFLGAVGQSLLTSSRYTPFAGVPAGLQAASARNREQGSEDALGLVLNRAGIDPATAASVARNPTAAALLVSTENEAKARDFANRARQGAPGLPGMPPASFGGMGGPVPPAGQPRASGDLPPVAETIFNGIVKRGGSPMLAAAAVGNFGSESSFNPAENTGDNGTAHGLGQWRLERAEGLKRLAATTGRDWRDPEVQMDHLMNEVRGGDAGAARALALIEQSKTPQEAAMHFAQHFERPSNEALVKSGVNRQALAQAAFDRFGNAASASPGAAVMPGGQPPVTTADASDLPRDQVAAAGAKIPVPLPTTPPPPKPNYGPETTTMKAWGQHAFRYGMRLLQSAGGAGSQGKYLVEEGKAYIDAGREFLKPTEIERVLDAAGVQGPAREALLIGSVDKRPDSVRAAEYAYPGQVGRQRQAVAAGMPDNRPESVRLGEAYQDSPGLVRSGIEAEAARKGADTAATSKAEALTKESAAATSSGRQAKDLLEAVDKARGYFEQAAKGGGVGPYAGSSWNRFLAARIPTLSGQANANEVARQNYELTIASIKNAKVKAEQQGLGSLSNLERVLASADIPGLDVVDPTVGYNALDALKARMVKAVELDRQIGLHAGEARAPAAGPPPRLGATAVNPRTGQRLQFDGSGWVPVR